MGFWFYTVTSQSLPLTIISYMLPILICLRTKDRLQPGPWNMGTWGPMVRSGAVFYLLLALLIVTLPTELPITPASFPYSSITAAACVLFMQVCWWLPVVGGRHFYSGPASEGIGRVRFAVRSSVLTPLPRRVRFSTTAAAIPVRRDLHRLAQAASLNHVAESKLLQPQFESHRKQLGFLLGWWIPTRWWAPAARVKTNDDLDSCRPSPNSFFRQPTLRIPGENEALNRAKSSPTHPSGYAWDRDAAQRLGHQVQQLSNQKSCRRRWAGLRNRRFSEDKTLHQRDELKQLMMVWYTTVLQQDTSCRISQSWVNMQALFFDVFRNNSVRFTHMLKICQPLQIGWRVRHRSLDRLRLIDARVDCVLNSAYNGYPNPPVHSTTQHTLVSNAHTTNLRM